MNPFARNLIDGLGGTTAVARKVKASVSTVQGWKKTLTASRRDHLERLAADEGKLINPRTGEVSDCEERDPSMSEAGSRASAAVETGNETTFSPSVAS